MKTFKDFEYEIIDDEATITKYSGKEPNVVIPSEMDGLKVTHIGEWAFSYCSSLTNVTIPNSVTHIGYEAFYGCSSLTSITIPNSVTSIGTRAFCDCSSLTSTTIPNSVTSIRKWAFSYCSSLTSITIPNSVTRIDDYAFYNCSALKSVNIPNSVTHIGEGAFGNCRSLASVNIPNSVTHIGYEAFEGCGLYSTKSSNYKAFSLKNNELCCRNYIFKESEWSDNIDNPELGTRGYHYCTNLFEIFNHYWGRLDKDITIYECEVGDIVIESETSKCVTNKIKPIKRLYREDVIKILNNTN